MTEGPKTTFPLHLNPNTVWMIRGLVRPGISVDWPSGSPAAQADDVTRTLRRKANTAILRMIDEQTEDIEIDCTENEAWLIDGAATFDGPDGPGTDLILQVIRGLWYLDIGQHLSSTPQLSSDPRGGWSNTTLKHLVPPADDPSP